MSAGCVSTFRTSVQLLGDVTLRIHASHLHFMFCDVQPGSVCVGGGGGGGACVCGWVGGRVGGGVWGVCVRYTYCECLRTDA